MCMSSCTSVNRDGRPICTGHAQRPAIRPVDRAVDRLKSPHSRVGAGQPGGRPLALARSTGRSTGGTTIIKMTVGRSTGRSTRRSVLPFPGCQRADFWRVITPPPWLISSRLFRAKIFHLLKCFSNKFKRVFVPKDLFFICF